MGIIHHLKSQGASLLHMVPKSSRDWKPHGDFCLLNTATIPDRYTVPHIQDFTANLADAEVFSEIDLICSYHQILVHPDDIPETAVITPLGLWKFLHMRLA